ncbi:MAG: hypothetical protein VR72_21665 [Clostridiaceae bacterium BRH_c20a]|nr:MAG: hypothetical protein VR72_21665 [Clostridiaceae bacterium BRH_c20a]
MLIVVILFILGIILIIKGGDIFTDGAIWLAGYTGIPQVIIGATVVSVATTVPEFTVSLIATLSGHPDMAVGNVVGSSIVNIGLILALSILIAPVIVTNSMKKGSLIMVSSGVIFVFFLQDKTITSVNAVFLLAMMIPYFIYNFRHANIKKNSQNGNIKDSSQTGAIKKNLILFGLGAVLIIVGSKLLIDNGSKIAEFLGIPELLIALTFISLGTSLPELVTAATSALKGNPEIGAGNVLGANFLNMTMIFGGTALIVPVPIPDQTLILDAPVMLSLMFATTLFLFNFKKLNRIHGLIIITIYSIYLYMLVNNSYI